MSCTEYDARLGIGMFCHNERKIVPVTLAQFNQTNGAAGK
jgi:hypothetical protein